MKAFEIWAVAHPYVIGFAAFWTLLSLTHWPKPKNPKLVPLWRLIIKISFMAWDVWGGEFKPPGIIYPQEPEEEAPKGTWIVTKRPPPPPPSEVN